MVDVLRWFCCFVLTRRSQSGRYGALVLSIEPTFLCVISHCCYINILFLSLHAQQWRCGYFWRCLYCVRPRRRRIHWYVTLFLVWCFILCCFGTFWACSTLVHSQALGDDQSGTFFTILLDKLLVFCHLYYFYPTRFAYGEDQGLPPHLEDWCCHLCILFGLIFVHVV